MTMALYARLIPEDLSFAYVDALYKLKRIREVRNLLRDTKSKPLLDLWY